MARAFGSSRSTAAVTRVSIASMAVERVRDVPAMASVAVNSPADQAKSSTALTLARPVPSPVETSATPLDLSVAQMRQYL